MLLGVRIDARVYENGRRDRSRAECTGLLIRSFHSLSRVNPGFQPAGLTAVQINLAGPRYEADEAQIAFYRQALAKLHEIPTVERACAISWLRLGSGLGSATDPSFSFINSPCHPTVQENDCGVACR